MALPCGRGVSLALANDKTAPAHLISARDPFRAPRSRVPDGRSLSVGVESPTASAHSNPTQKTLAVRAGQNKFLKDSPKITCPPHQPQNLTKPASPLPISLSQTWHSYPHPTPTIELAPKLSHTARSPAHLQGPPRAEGHGFSRATKPPAPQEPPCCRRTGPRRAFFARRGGQAGVEPSGRND
jgi:hypothetical protein